MDKKQLTLGVIIKEYWNVLVFLVVALVGYIELRANTAEALRTANANEEWRIEWEKNGGLPADRDQNRELEILTEKVKNIEALDLDARLATIETILHRIDQNISGQ